MELIFIIGAIQAFFWVILILNKKDKQLPDYLLSAWLMVIGLNIFMIYLEYTPYNYQWWPYTIGINSAFPCLHGPFLLLYIQSQNRDFDQLKPVHALHLIPFLTTYIIFFEQFLMSKPELIHWIETIAVSGGGRLIFQEILVTGTGIFYVVWSWIALEKHGQKVERFYSFTQDVSLNWLRNLVIGMGIIWVTVLVSQYFFWVFARFEDDFMASSALIYVFASLFVFFIGFYGIRQGVVFGNQNPETVQKVTTVDKLKYERSGLKPEQAEKLKTALLAHMTSNKPHLDSKLTIAQLAEQLGIPQNHLSQVINEQLSHNFYEFVNKYRLEEFKNRVVLDQQKTYTLLAHAFESGFSSKSTFNEIFKKYEGKTPSEYLKQQKEV